MHAQLRRLTPFFFFFFALAFCDAGITISDAEARSRSGGRSFQRSTPPKATPATPNRTATNPSSNRGLLGGLVGGALGGLLLGSLFGMGGSGMGILPIILLGVAGYFLYRRFMASKAGSSRAPSSPPLWRQQQDSLAPSSDFDEGIMGPVEQGLAEIRAADKDFDEEHFKEVASDVFFKVQAGWMRRDLSSFRHLLGNTLAEEYAQHFAEMEKNGHINKLESIAVRKAEITAAGSVNGEDFVTLLFTANLLDYTVDEASGEVIKGSMTEPVKFAEKWTWARSVGSEDWKLEGIEVL
jgi:predicted lipid-binding transport protein (Tim44 family)